MQKLFAPACACTSINPKIFPGRSPGSSKKTAMRQPSRQRIFPTPHPPDSMLLHSFAWHSLQKKQPFPFGCRHGPVNNIDCGGAGASRVMWQHIRGWLFFLKNPVCHHGLLQVIAHQHPTDLRSLHRTNANHRTRGRSGCFQCFIDYLIDYIVLFIFIHSGFKMF